MQLYYIDDGKMMNMEMEDKPISIPVIVRYYKALDTLKVNIIEDNWDINDMERTKRKQPEKYNWYFGKLICPTEEVNNRDAWVCDINLPENLDDRFRYDWVKTFDFFFRTRCSRDNYPSIEKTLTIHNQFYYKDAIVSRHINSTLHLYGEGIINSKNIFNCLVYIHGKYEVR